jgi:hypothetical protein
MLYKIYILVYYIKMDTLDPRPEYQRFGSKEDRQPKDAPVWEKLGLPIPDEPTTDEDRFLYNGDLPDFIPIGKDTSNVVSIFSKGGNPSYEFSITTNKQENRKLSRYLVIFYDRIDGSLYEVILEGGDTDNNGAAYYIEVYKDSPGEEAAKKILRVERVAYKRRDELPDWYQKMLANIKTSLDDSQQEDVSDAGDTDSNVIYSDRFGEQQEDLEQGCFLDGTWVAGTWCV